MTPAERRLWVIQHLDDGRWIPWSQESYPWRAEAWKRLRAWRTAYPLRKFRCVAYVPERRRA